MRVLCVGVRYPPHHIGGYELHCRSVVEHLRSAGHEVAVLTSTLRVPGVHAPEEPGVRRGLTAHDPAGTWPGWQAAGRVERRNVAVLRRALADCRPDVVCWWRLGELSLSLVEHVRRAGVPAVGVICDQWLLEGPARDPWRRPWLAPDAAGAPGGTRPAGGVWRIEAPWRSRSPTRPRASAAARPAGVARRAGAAVAGALTGLPVGVDWSGAAEWLFVSAWLRERTLAAGPALARTGIAHAGIALELLAYRGPPPPWGGSLLYAGRLSRLKGAEDAVAALAALPRDTTLTVHGHGSPADHERLRTAARRAGVGDRLHLQPPAGAEAMAGVYAAHDALVFPSRWEEPWGLVPLEAMAVGLPVVATGTGGSAEYLEDGANALRVAPGAPAALAGAVRRLAGDRALRERLVARGRKTAERFPASACDDVILARLRAAVAPH